MSLLKQLPRPRPYISRQCICPGRPIIDTRRQHGTTRAITWASKTSDPKLRDAQWEQRADRIKNGIDKSMLAILEERGFVKDVAGYVVQPQMRGVD